MSHHDEDRQRDDDRHEHPSSRPDSGANSISTDDAEVMSEAEHRDADRSRPETVVLVGPNDEFPAAESISPVSGRTLVVERRVPDRPTRSETRPADEERSRGRRRRDQDEDRDDDEEENEPSFWAAHSGTILGLIVGLLLGLAAAWAYWHFYASKSDESQGNSSQSSGQTSGAGSSSPKSKSTQSNEEGEDQTSRIPGVGEADSFDAVQKQLEALAERMDRLRLRLDRVETPNDTLPPGLKSLQIKVGELASEVDDVSYLPERVRRLENRIDELNQRLRSLREQAVLSSGGSSDAGSGERTDTLPPASTEASPGGEQPSDPCR